MFVMPLLSALLCLGLAGCVLWRNPRSLAHRGFALGMVSLALRESGNLLGWQGLIVVGEALLPGSWLLFALSFARGNGRESVARWKGIIVSFYGFPLILLGLFWSDIFSSPSGRGFLPLLGAGYLFYLSLFLGLVVVLVNLENTLRASTGITRWQIKYMILGVGSLLSFLLYTYSQTLLFSAVQKREVPLASFVILIAGGLIAFSLVRHRLLDVEVFVSRHFVYGSFVLLTVGGYLVIVGLMVKALQHLGGPSYLSFTTPLVFLSLLGLVVLLLSEGVKRRVKAFIARHFYRHKYDYRDEWLKFTEKIHARWNRDELIREVSSQISETCGVPHVTIWLPQDMHQWHHGHERNEELIQVGGNTPLERGGRIRADHPLIRVMRERRAIVDLEEPADPEILTILTEDPGLPQQIGATLCVPLVAGERWLGMLALGKKLIRTPFDSHDHELLSTVAAQLASSLLNLHLLQELFAAKEMEVTHQLTTFFLHDLKNMTSTLSLVVQNMAEHGGNPEFRRDALQTLSHTASTMKELILTLSSFSHTLELHPQKIDLNSLLRQMLSRMNGSLRSQLSVDLGELPPLTADPEQVEKLLLNMILNAEEATAGKGTIAVRTGTENGWVTVTVSDDGCGMSREFVEAHLFKPFRTTKSQGTGIGLFQCEKIVRAHKGQIEVKSKVGQGSTFTVMFPAQGE